jgi:protein disulfide-isomerase
MKFLSWLVSFFLCFIGQSFAMSYEHIVPELLGVENIFDEAKENNRPILFVFLAKEQCPWSQKFLLEVIRRAHFIEEMQKDCFVQTVYVTTKINNESNVESKLIEHFQIREFPQLILLTPHGEIIHQEGFLPLDGDHYVQRYKECIRIYNELKDFMSCSSLDNQDEGLERFYSKASEHGMIQLQHIIKSFAKDSSSLFFLLERYEELLKTKKKKDPQVQQVRSQIIASDPENTKKGMLRLAMVDFLSLEEHKKNRKSPKEMIQPLEDYIKDFGDRDSDNLWKIEMVIAQFLFSKAEVSSAVKHATKCLQAAPLQMKDEIAQTLEFMKHHSSNR